MDVLISEPFYSALLLGLGMTLFLLEIFVPSGGILGLLALAGVGLGVFGFFYQGRSIIGGCSLVAVTIGGFVILRYGLSRLELKGSLPPETCSSVEERIEEYAGREGVAITPLRPAGLARIGSERVDVVSTGRLIEKGARVRVVETSGNRVVVREIQEKQEE